MQGPHLRPLDLTDDATAAAVHRVGRAAYAVEAQLIGFDGIPALGESLERMRARRLRWLGAVAEGGAVAGFLAWEETEDGVSIDRLCVDPARFRRGIGSLLVRHALTELFPDRPVGVTTGADNTPAVTLYERHGFTRGADFSPVPGLRMASFTLRRAGAPAPGGSPHP
ncbi:GNAT family N-acetyltransferase [Streptomyces sp. NBC_00091]|uniref:GNAT family N-acetyltransferase n=1 Tax=Streptomyces sp. NBC_00091 TaxID=2975648 RepID=UPI00225A8ADC|nr:GNAT family N-acetyltransferase [Streptomyces sp. NBC_00091]MCX5379393.1 GNAT family N-acetyltransferase [Streptomyces sp. NBC_00091]